MKRIPGFDRAFGLLFLCIPAALVLRHLTDAPPTAVFTVSALAIVPLAGMMGRATERLAQGVGPGIGGLLNATFGNAAELIVGIVALRAGLADLVKASITGSIIGNVLLVFGLAALLGGLRYPAQRFNRTAASLGSTLLVLSAIGLVIPAIFHSVGGGGPAREQQLSLWIAIVLICTYGLSLVFALRTHPYLYLGSAAAAGRGWNRVAGDGGSGEQGPGTGGGGRHGPPAGARTVEDPDRLADADPDLAAKLGRSGVASALLRLVVAAALVGVMSEILVGTVEEAARALGMSEVFIGVILIALIGNAAEHSTAVLMAIKGKMELAVHIAIGSSMQIALFVAPLLLLLSYVIGPGPIDLRFTTMEVVAVALSVGIMALIAGDGETHWMEGALLLAVYLILGVAFFALPA